jgi:hypothetical protein
MTLLLLAAVLTDFSFLAGAWKGEAGPSIVEEHWMAPDGETMLGMSREIRDGKTTVTELCSIEMSSGVPVLVIRHFNSALIAREGKDKPLVFALESSAPGKAVFFHAERNTRVIYERKSETELVITLERERDGKKSSLPFRYRRIT